MRLTSALGLSVLLLAGCGAPNPRLGRADHEGRNEGQEAWDRLGRWKESFGPGDVALTDAERTRFCRRLELDTLGHTENTALLIATAYRSPDERRRLFARVPGWFRSPRRDTRCMAFTIVKFLEEPGYEAQASSLLADLRGGSPAPGTWEAFTVEDLETYLRGGK